MVSGEVALSEMVRDYYKNLFHSSRPMEVEEVVLSNKPTVTDEMNNRLTRPFSQEEIEGALNQMAPLKAPGPDGIPPIFFKNFGMILVTM